jgi:hypothetical protein
VDSRELYRRTLEIQSIDIAPDAGRFTHHTMLGVVFLHLVLMNGSRPGFALVAAQNAYERGTGCIRLSAVTSLIPTHRPIS